MKDIFAFGLLHKAHQIAKDAFGDAGMTPTQYLILRAICAKGDGVIQTSLVSATGIDRSTMDDLDGGLGRSGLVARTVSREAGGGNTAARTERGWRVRLEHTEAAERANEASVAAIRESQQKAFLRHLERIGKEPVQAVKVAA